MKQKKLKGENIIYKYVEDGEIIYIGKTDSSLRGRIEAHAKERKFLDHKNAEIYYVELENSDQTYFAEIALIDKYKPKLNVTHNRPMNVNNPFAMDVKEPDWIKYEEYGDAGLSNMSCMVHRGDKDYTFCDRCYAVFSPGQRCGIDFEIFTGRGFMATRLCLCRDCYNELFRDKFNTMFQEVRDCREKRAKNTESEKLFGEMLLGEIPFHEYLEKMHEIETKKIGEVEA